MQGLVIGLFFHNHRNSKQLLNKAVFKRTVCGCGCNVLKQLLVKYLNIFICTIKRNFVCKLFVNVTQKRFCILFVLSHVYKNYHHNVI